MDSKLRKVTFLLIILILCASGNGLGLSNNNKGLNEEGLTPPIIHGVNRNISESPSSPPLLHEREEIEQNDGTHGHIHPHGGDYGHGLASSLISRDNCKLPLNWRGEWFQSGVVSSIQIDDKSIGDKGSCIERSGDKFLFYEKANNCYKCIVINERHPNVLQYKESPFCEDRDTLEHLCLEIQGDAVLYSIFRLQALAEECPFKGPFTFTYNRGHGECKNPVSYVDQCTENSRLRLRYQACPDIQKTESSSEELTCLAQWKEGSHHYLLGKVMKANNQFQTNEESYRCFMFEKTKGSGVSIGFNVAVSGDATCTGVFSPTEGAKALALTKVEKEEKYKCRFPPWLGSHWFTLDGKMSVKMHHKNMTMIIMQEESGDSGRRRNSSIPGGFGYPSLGQSRETGLFGGGARINCLSRKEVNEKSVVIVGHHMQGCKSDVVCIRLYKRDNHVIEVQMTKKSEMLNEDCFSKMDAERNPFITLVNQETRINNKCPTLGKFSASPSASALSQVQGQGGQDGRVLRDSSCLGFHSVIVGCGQRARMEFHSKCGTQEPVTAYECHGSWEENGTGFLIASPLSRSSTSARRYCFIYSETEDGLRVSSSSENCQRNVNPGIEGVWTFNLTVNGQCAEAVTGTASGSCDLPVLSNLLVLITIRLITIMIMR